MALGGQLCAVAIGQRALHGVMKHFGKVEAPWGECRLSWGWGWGNLTNRCSVWGEGISKVTQVVRGWDLGRLYRV